MSFFKQENHKDSFVKAKDKYGIFPITTWDINYSDKLTKDLKKEIGDGAIIHSDRQNSSSYNKDFTRIGYNSARKDCFTKETNDESVYRGKITESIFSPQIAQYIFSVFAPKEKGVVFDPFGGGDTRAIVACKNDFRYIGYEIRQEEVNAVNNRLKMNNIDNAKIVCGDSQNCNTIKDNTADFSITCPPYYNMERYNGGDNDLSMAITYEDFLQDIYNVAKETYRIMKDNTLTTLVIGLHRDKKKNLLPLHHDISYVYRKVGFNFKEEVVLCHKNNGAIQRVGNFEKGSNFLIRTHEYLLVFKKGRI